jgi:hypothetical protein
MQFSLQVICSKKNISSVTQKISELTEYLCLREKFSFVPYWKNAECMRLEIGAAIKFSPDYSIIEQYIRQISGADTLFISHSPENWECSHFLSVHQILSEDNKSFAVCNIYPFL